jgi:hypothetical protein
LYSQKRFSATPTHYQLAMDSGRGLHLPTELFNHEVEEVEKVFLSFKTIQRIPSLNDRTLKLNKNPNEIPESLK